MPLADGEQVTVFVASHLRMGFEGPEGEGGEHFALVHCRNLQLERSGDDVRRADDWGCEARRARGGQPTRAPDEDASTPGPGAAAIAASLALAAAAARWR